MALWELATPVFVGTFMAFVVSLMLMGKAHKLLRGPRWAFAWAFDMPMPKCGCECTCKGCRRRRTWRAYKQQPKSTCSHGSDMHGQKPAFVGKRALIEKGRDGWVSVTS